MQRLKLLEIRIIPLGVSGKRKLFSAALIWIKPAARRRLRQGSHAANIAAVILSRYSRQFVAGIAAVLFLACQGMAAASAPSPAFAQSGADAAQGPCHGTGGDAGRNAGDGCPASCQFQNASNTPSKVVYSTIDLPAIVVAFDHFVPVASSAPPVVSWLAQIEPPPLRILNCCLRN